MSGLESTRPEPDMLSLDSPIRFAHAPEEGIRLAAALHHRRPLFVCVIGSTDTALIPGISGAGISQDHIRFTAPADAELIVHGAARCLPGVPSNPLGPPGPALITRAALELADIRRIVVNVGCSVQPDAPCVDLGTAAGGCITDGNAVPEAKRLFSDGETLGARLAADADYLVVGESVPGGTTTALALLLALGIAADGRVSSSMVENAHGLKSTVARQALGQLRSDASADPLAAVAVLGDPMQPAAAGIAAGALGAGCPVLLAGGTQMIAVLALLQRLKRTASLFGGPAASASTPMLAVATTRWIVDDPLSDDVLIAKSDSAPPVWLPFGCAAALGATARSEVPRHGVEGRRQESTSCSARLSATASRGA